MCRTITAVFVVVFAAAAAFADTSSPDPNTDRVLRASCRITDESPTVLTCGAQGGAAVSLQRGHIVRRTRDLIYYKPEALPGRSGSPLFNEDGSRVIGLVAWRTGDGHGLAMNSAAVRSFLRGEVAEVESKLPEDAIPLWQSSTMLVLVTSKGCRPCELQKQAMPDDVEYRTFDIEYVNEKGYDVKSTPTFMVFVDEKLQDQRSGLLRGDGLAAFLNRWGFSRDGDQPEEDEELHDDDWNPWNNPRRWNRGPIHDRIDQAKTKFAWWLLGKWLGFTAAGFAIAFPSVVFIVRALRKLRSSSEGCPVNKRPQLAKRTSPKRPKKPTPRRRRSSKR